MMRTRRERDEELRRRGVWRDRILKAVPWVVFFPMGILWVVTGAISCAARWLEDRRRG